MSIWRQIVHLGAALVAASATSAAAHPLWSSDDVRAARPVAPVEALVVDVRIDDTRDNAEPRITQGVATLAPTFTYLDASQDRTLYDRAACVVLTWTAGAGVFDNQSCYASPAVRFIELQNRAQIRKLIPAPGADASKPGDPFWDEAELGIGASAAKRISTQRKGDAVQYRLDGATVATVTASNFRMSPEEARRLSGFLANTAALHPAIRAGATAGGVLPATIELDVTPWDGTHHRQSITLSNPRRVTTEYPLPGGLASKIRRDAEAGNTALDKAVRRIAQVVDGTAKDHRPAVADLSSRLKDSKDPLTAMMLFMNLTQQYAAAFQPDAPGGSLMGDVGPVVRLALQDPATKRFMEASRLAGAPGDGTTREQAARYLASATQLDDLPFGTFRYVTYANLVRGTQDASGWDPAIASAMPRELVDNYWIHIAAYPWAANVYKDAGDTYLSGYDAPMAWLAYDLGRAVDPAWRDGPTRQVEQLEVHLREVAPDFF